MRLEPGTEGREAGRIERNRALDVGSLGGREVGNEAQGIPRTLLPDHAGSPEAAPSEPARERGLRRAFRELVDFNWRLSAKVDAAAAVLGREAGWSAFPAQLEAMLRPGMKVIDLGSGRTPSIPIELKRRLGLHVVGVDISQEELDAAPSDGYDEVFCTSAESFVRKAFADLVVSRALAEHLRNPVAMFHSIHESLKPGGETIHFVPNGNALFAVLNRVVPQDVKRKLLHTIYPLSKGYLGFPAYYRQCTPRAVRVLFRALGLRDARVTPYFGSNYFVALVPAHLAMVGWQLAMQKLGAENHCESFIVRARR